MQVDLNWIRHGTNFNQLAAAFERSDAIERDLAWCARANGIDDRIDTQTVGVLARPSAEITAAMREHADARRIKLAYALKQFKIAGHAKNFGGTHCARQLYRQQPQRAACPTDQHCASGTHIRLAQSGVSRPKVTKARRAFKTDCIWQLDQATGRRGDEFTESAIRVILVDAAGFGTKTKISLESEGAAVQRVTATAGVAGAAGAARVQVDTITDLDAGDIAADLSNDACGIQAVNRR